MNIFGILVLLFSLAANKSDDPSPACRITFSIDNAGVAVEGTMEVIDAEIKFDAGALDRSSITATADPSTIRTGITIRDKHLERSDYFDAAQYPAVTLRSRSFRKVRKNTFTGAFDLTIKDITRPVMITFTVAPGKHTTAYRGTFVINRLDFGLGESSNILGEEVKIALVAEG
jgi:polyisoprenoid-binding protein YceI